MIKINLLDCTLRDGGYYNSWDFSVSIIEEYLKAMDDIAVSAVELGLRSLEKEGFKGPCAYTTDNFIESLSVPQNLVLGVMVNASELLKYPEGVEGALENLFAPANESRVSLVRIACHFHEFQKALPAATWLKEQGYIVGFNLMQIADKTAEEIENLAKFASDYPIDILYFADSLGGLIPADISKIVSLLRKHWKGDLGIHTHDNMGYALANSLQAIEEGVTWIDGTVTGMGRGPGNVKTEYLAIEIAEITGVELDLTALMIIIDKYFKPLQIKCGWGTNMYYYLSGKYGIHPTYIQEMINDVRYDSEDILSVIEYLRNQEKHKYSKVTLSNARNFYSSEPKGNWVPEDEIKDRTVLILGTGEGVYKYRRAIEEYIHLAKPYVIALNTQEIIDTQLIDVRAACHPSRLMADFKTHLSLPQPLVMPFSMITTKVHTLLENKEIRDFGIFTEDGKFKFEKNYCHVPKTLVAGYALAIASSGKARNILLAGFDGYEGEDARNEEMNDLLNQYLETEGSIPIKAVTPTKYQMTKASIFQMIGDYTK